MSVCTYLTRNVFRNSFSFCFVYKGRTYILAPSSSLLATPLIGISYKKSGQESGRGCLFDM